MATVKIKWRVSEAPTGRYRSFERRSWPTGEHPVTGAALAAFSCEDKYEPRKIKTGDHKPIKVRLAIKNSPEDRATGKGPWSWRALKGEFATLNEAKSAANDFYNKHSKLFNEG